MSDALAMFDRAVGAATCNILNSGGNAVLLNTVVGAALVPGGQVPALAAGLGLLAINLGCAFDRDNGGPPVSDFYPPGCWKVAAGDYLVLGESLTSGIWVDGFFEFISLVDTGVSGGFGTTYWEATWKMANGDVQSSQLPRTPEEISRLQLLVKAGGTCVQEGPGGGEVPPTYTYVDQSTGCSLDVDFLAWGHGDDGRTVPVVKIEPTPAPQVRNDGGIIQGCNFQPVVWVGGGGDGGGGGGYTYPWVDGPEDPPWWLPYVQGALGGVAAAVVDSLLGQLLEENVGQKVYRLVSVCETDSQGEPISESREVDIPDLPMMQAIIYRLDALEYLLQGLKDFKQPICSRSKPVGDFVTVHFQSDEISIGGERPLRKYLRYRDQMASDLAAHAAHWENFAWQAGPVIVIHKDAPWGIVKVWAATADEGKRVIRHAGEIAGIQVDTEGNWLITSSDDPRYGRTGTMRLGRRKSNQGMVLQISKRGGPDGLPIVPVDPIL